MKRTVSVRLKEDVVRDIDRYREKMNYSSRTDFVKEAIKYYLEKRGKKIPHR